MTVININKDTREYVCKDCGWIGTLDKTLKADHPFQEDEKIYGCPQCMELENTLFLKCQYPGCKKLVQCGYNSKNGYKSTCNDHFMAEF